MNWLIFAFALELGIIPIDEFVMYNPSIEIVFDQSLYVEIEGEALLFDLLFIGGSIRTYIWKNKEGISFWPWRDGFLFNAGIKYKYVELGFKHYCTHPIIPYIYPVQMNWEGAYQEFYLRFEGKIK
ncbi:MAG: hypothetical protein ACTSPI_00310 [Candidatus Heimdallarchaeaceae archaeon]